MRLPIAVDAPSLRSSTAGSIIAAVVVLVPIMRHGVTASRMERLSDVLGVDRRTVERGGASSGMSPKYFCGLRTS
jgi:hypothetical protein